MDERGTDEASIRLEKLHRIAAAGVDPYPAKSAISHKIGEVLMRFDDIAKKGESVVIGGRLMAQRGHGGALFADLEDGTGKIQLHLKRDIIGAEAFAFFTANIDRGDFLQITGTVFVTKMGEKTIAVSGFTLLSKSLASLPEKWHGLTDTEIRYRKRYLDLVSNPEVRAIFRKRSLIVQTIREFFAAKGFMEVETPILQPIAGGATARPFVTHHNALDIDLYLRVAPELYLKRLIVGGFERVFEIGRNFRNEGIDHLHNPEFTSIEAYQAYADYREHMIMTEELLTLVVGRVNGSPVLEVGEMKIDFTAPYPRITFRDAVLQYAGVDIEQCPDRASLAKAAESKGVKVEAKDDRGAILDNLYKKTVRANIVDPTFVIDHPLELSPLAKKKPEDGRYVERFQLVLGRGIELANAYSELNDPIDQRRRFEEQERLRQGGDDEAQHMDLDFVEALETGMPPTAGWAIGIDRLVALLTGSHGLKEVILFPTLRPEK
ncbi:lysine--tRNA ligase [Candidatus Uhrbacteria bacterium]|nr:lysine--tRNA ligase [Candidatus Uhrbacteria bacterium]